MWFITCHCKSAWKSSEARQLLKYLDSRSEVAEAVWMWPWQWLISLYRAHHQSEKLFLFRTNLGKDRDSSQNPQASPVILLICVSSTLKSLLVTHIRERSHQKLKQMANTVNFFVQLLFQNKQWVKAKMKNTGCYSGLITISRTFQMFN